MPTEPPAAIQALIDTSSSAFNSKDAALYSSCFGCDVVIVDGIALDRWTSLNAQAVGSATQKNGSYFGMSPPTELASRSCVGESLLVNQAGLRLRGISYTELL